MEAEGKAAQGLHFLTAGEQDLLNLGGLVGRQAQLLGQALALAGGHFFGRALAAAVAPALKVSRVPRTSENQPGAERYRTN